MIPAATEDDRAIDRAMTLIRHAESQIAEAGGNATPETVVALATAYATLALAQIEIEK